MSHVGDEDHGLDDLGEGRTSLLEDGIEVLAALAGLVGNGALDDSTVSSEGDGTRAVDGVGGLDGLGLFFLFVSFFDLANPSVRFLRRDRRLRTAVSELERRVLEEQQVDLRAGAPVVKMLVCSAIVEVVWKEAENGVNLVFLGQSKGREAAAASD